MMSLNTNTQSEVLQPHTFTAGGDKISARQTPYGKFLETEEETVKDLFEDAEKNHPGIAFDAPENIEGQQALAMRQAIDVARTKQDFDGLMKRTIGYMNVGPDEAKEMSFEKIPTPGEAEKIFLEMGRKQFPELSIPSLRDVCDLWRQTKLGDVPSELAHATDVRAVLPQLRNGIWFIMTNSDRLLNSAAGKSGAKLVYAMMVLERNASGDSQMTVREKMAADAARNSLK